MANVCLAVVHIRFLSFDLVSGPAVTCIQFNPLDDNYFISGSLDAKIRLWNIPVRQVVDWTDLHEMVTASSFTPDGLVQLLCILLLSECYGFINS